MPEDRRAEPPEQPKTVSIPAVTDRALLEDLGRVVRNMADNVGTMSQNVTVLMEDRPVLHSRLAGVEGRLARLEQPSIIPPPPITSTRVRAIVEGTSSQMDLETAAKQADEIVKGQERDRRIDETHALVQKAATKEDLADLVTKKDVEAVVSDATALQTTALVTEISKNKKVRIIAGLIATFIIGWLGKVATTPPPPAPTPAPTHEVSK